jgi:hypothetical protein
MDLTLTDEIIELSDIELAERYGCDPIERVMSEIRSDIGDNVRAIAKIHNVEDKVIYHELKKHFGKSQSKATLGELLERLFYTTALRKQEQRGKPHKSTWPKSAYFDTPKVKTEETKRKSFNELGEEDE